MKKNNKGFFLIEAVVVITLITVVMAYVYPNLAKLYDNFENRSKYYDQTEDLYELKAYYEEHKNDITCDPNTNITRLTINSYNDKNLEELYISGYVKSNSDSDYNFNKYLKRMKINTNDSNACRLIGIFEKPLLKPDGTKDGTKTYKTYASIKVY